MPTTNELPELTIKGKRIRFPILQGGMGVGVSLHTLSGAVSRFGGMGIISSACLDRIVSKRTGRQTGVRDAVYQEVSLAKDAGGGQGAVGINIMCALMRDFVDSVKGAIDARVDAIVAGAGLPLTLPSIQELKDTALIPIVSSGRALELICRKWERLHYRPDAVVLEGPLAGGHLGFAAADVEKPEHRLENLLGPVKDVARKFGDFPVIVAGGIFTREDILAFLRRGANGVQMGTRFLATHESSASPAYKQAVVEATDDDILVADRPGSPCGLPFRVLKNSPMYRATLAGARPPRCDKGYVLRRDGNGSFLRCPTMDDVRAFFCICNGLLSSGGYNPDDEQPLYTVGAMASRVDRIMSVGELMGELTGAPA